MVPYSRPGFCVTGVFALTIATPTRLPFRNAPRNILIPSFVVAWRGSPDAGYALHPHGVQSHRTDRHEGCADRDESHQQADGGAIRRNINDEPRRRRGTHRHHDEGDRVRLPHTTIVRHERTAEFGNARADCDVREEHGTVLGGVEG